jgi:pantetheine-phosphate adenylyltransferase
MRTALFPGSFDPITMGHVEIIERGLAIFDTIVVAVGVNSSKSYMFSVEERLQMLRDTFADEPRIQVASFQELTVEFARKNNIPFILRGLRSPNDLAYEQPIAYVNQHLHPSIEIVCLLSKPETVHISSSIVREIIKYKGNVQSLVPQSVIDVIDK